MKTIRIICAVAAALLLLLPLCSCAGGESAAKEEMRLLYGENNITEGEYDSSLAAHCSNGTFVGVKDGDVLSFKGIPYAKAPVGELRWKPPVPAADGDGVYEAYYFGASPVQTEWPSEVGSYYPQSEDCLTLNVWTNTSDTSANKSVMVFIHGGSYGWGAVPDPLYDGHNLVEKYSDIILVSVEYRLGIFGFIDFSSVPGGEEYAESGNLGLLDQVCALRWIKKNIAAFGGNPDNVTVFGESAGAGSVSLLPLIDGTDGLFSRVIAESGSVALTYGREECRNLTDLLLKESGCKNMSGLSALGTDELIKINESLNDYNNFPERDGVVLPVDLYEAYENGGAGSFDMLIGTNADEVLYWINEMSYYVPLLSGEFIFRHALPVMFDNNMKALTAQEKELVDSFMKMQTGKRARKQTAFYNELLFRVPAMKQAEYHSANGNNVYTYYWTRSGADKTTGACHAIELAYVFNNPQVTIYTGGEYDSSLAGAVQDMWVNFARTGNPSTEDYTWDTYDAKTRKTMVLGENVQMQQDIMSRQREIIEPVLCHYFNGCYSQLSFNVPAVYRIAAQVFAGAFLLSALLTFTIKAVKSRKKGRRQ